jgi:sec-independent protein translocase protein TatB
MFPEDRFLEILIIGAIALIVIGPKDLPILMRKIGRFVGRMRGMAAEFRASFDELARQSELDELRKEVEALRYNQTPSMVYTPPPSPATGAPHPADPPVSDAEPPSHPVVGGDTP